MNIGNAISQYVHNYESITANVSTTERSLNNYRNNSEKVSSKSKDTVEISSDGYEM